MSKLGAFDDRFGDLCIKPLSPVQVNTINFSITKFTKPGTKMSQNAASPLKETGNGIPLSHVWHAHLQERHCYVMFGADRLYGTQQAGLKQICLFYLGLCYHQACLLKFKLSDFTSCICSVAALDVCFVGRMAGLDVTETGNEFSPPKFEFRGLIKKKEGQNGYKGPSFLAYLQQRLRIWYRSGGQSFLGSQGRACRGPIQ